MRRILLGGLGIALGVFTPPLLAQQPAPTPPARAAKFGRPSAIPSGPAPAASPVQPAGLFGSGPAQSTVSYAPGGFGTPTPVVTQPPASAAPAPTGYPALVGSDTAPGAPGPAAGAPPMVIETRDPTGRIPTGTVVPSVVPDGLVCPDPGLDDPLYNDGSSLGRVGLGRLRGCGRTWVSAETLLWWNRGTQVPALITTSSPQYNGIVGQGDTQVLLGGSFGSTFHVGARVGGGYWFDDNGCRGLDWRVFWVAPSSSTFTATDPPYALLARPFVNVNPNILTPSVPAGPSSEVVAGPGVATGAVTAVMKSTVWGAEANYRRFLAGNGTTTRLDLLVGYRYLDLAESLTITESFTRVPSSDLNVGTAATSGVVFDRFRTENHFHGGQVGFAGTIQRGRWSLDGRATVALGTVFQSADISGGQALTFANGTVQSTSGGLLALPSNIGHYSQARFAVVPEVGLNVGYQVTSRMKVFVGYNFLYLSSAVRPGTTIDQNVDAARIPNFLPAGSATPVSPHPTPQLATSGYFIQGINFGLIYRW
ncbi:BBP7 family outer membrane beta-barrel protein [Frigoriglobus tundricola]|uniref:Uncharacterized protein n=1 Tax=Frigoriglobus tundricola TaxID=2774151 RepID=A0A6M5YKP9_9BACT|nr:BBP7 family outer membrane beta-barrel protein [Frigoriglobus tundricola]QJW94548.1 hypothetical protein FTUN_2069 [Frigoriglobus tundricola]